MIDPPTSVKISKDKKTSIQVTNDMILQLLEVREDFEKIPHTSEVYTRSTSNHWIAGHRIYNTLRTNDENNEEEDANAATHESGSSLDEFPRDENMDDFTEMYLIAAKKDTSLADIEGKPSPHFIQNITNQFFLIETLGKMTTSLLDTMHIE